jgi:transposase
MSSAVRTGAVAHERVGKRKRRAWSEAEKRLIVEEALAPGASVAEVARRHGANANLVFNWRRIARSSPAADRSSATEREPVEAVPSVVMPGGFIPIGMIAGPADADPSRTATSATDKARQPSAQRVAASRARGATRAGLIGIDLSDGTRVQVDAAVDEEALRRVLSVLRASS